MTQTMVATDRAIPFQAALAEIRSLLDNDLFGDDKQWAGMLWYGLARLQERLRQETDPATTPTGPDSEVDHTRNTLHRRHEKLRHDLHDLLEQCQALKWEMYSAAQPSTSHEEPLGKTPPLRETSEGELPDYEALKQHIRRLLDQLEAKHTESVSLVLESVTTDLGAGD